MTIQEYQNKITQEIENKLELSRAERMFCNERNFKIEAMCIDMRVQAFEEVLKIIKCEI